MKRLIITAAIVTLLLSTFYFYNHFGTTDAPVAGYPESYVEKPTEIKIPDHIKWLDSLKSTNPELRDADEKVTIYNISKGDSFASILIKLGLSKKTVNKLSFLASQKFNLSSFKIGEKIAIYTYYGEWQPYKLEYPLSKTSYLKIDVKKLAVNIIDKPISTKVRTFESTIITSLASTLSKKNAPTDLADKLLSIFAWDVNFMKLQKEDIFGVVYEEQSVDNEVIGSDKILSAYIEHNGKKYTAYYFENDSIKGYFDEEGLNYSRAPLEYELITSLYQKRRFHPVKRRYRAHLGMDFMAPEGTPISAIKEGTVVAAGFQRANGNYVKIRHEEITTQYLHLQSIDSNIKVGKFIKRGTVIGKVGSTGLSSGPHLCLRVWDKGKQKDPLNYKFDRRMAIPDELMDEFNDFVTKQNTLLALK
ncbi:MAG: peptidoglycan DD-metalloendopeptidase family protein [Bacteroidota bacterium]